MNTVPSHREPLNPSRQEQLYSLPWIWLQLPLFKQGLGLQESISSVKLKKKSLKQTQFRYILSLKPRLAVLSFDFVCSQHAFFSNRIVVYVFDKCYLAKFIFILPLYISNFYTSSICSFLIFYLSIRFWYFIYVFYFDISSIYSISIFNLSILFWYFIYLFVLDMSSIYSF